MSKFRLTAVFSLCMLQSGCFLWPSTSVMPPDEPPLEQVSAYSPGQASVDPHIEPARPSVRTETAAGNGSPGGSDGAGASAQFNEPEGLAAAADGTLYIAEPYAYRIRRMTPDGRVATLAGGTLGRQDGVGAQAQFYGPKDIALAPDGTLYVSDFDAIRTISPDGRVSTLPVRSAEGEWHPVELFGITVDSQGAIYVSTPTAIDRIVGGVASRWVGAEVKGFRDGTGPSAYFNLPRKLAVDTHNNLYVADFGNLRVRKVTPGRVVTTVAGNGVLGFTDGEARVSRLNFPMGVAVDAQGNVLIADTYNHAIRVLSPSGQVSTLAGNNTAGYSDGSGLSIQFSRPTDVAPAPAGGVYVADTRNHRVRVIR